ncbi:hypothetical protein HH310_37665 [Actinoplanes sp. TBRC 11911]|uniref:hypothetical protein n=1 Tax=Actinoplanes sp. TBRC 11911 TaxID=2729386 RepID=UPI00145D44AE|nr:hypothetical protein [Actinoplanes sp. TBRC 11911]NMO56889.1 hypothetical protein [Actinoplanes sp. TBRC 11911]
MRVWLETLRAAWSVEPVSIRSPRPFDEVVRRLGSGTVIARAPDRAVIRLRPAARKVAAVWSPVLRGRLVPDRAGSDGDSRGCRLDGVIGCEPEQRALWLIWLGAIALAVGIMAVSAVNYAVSGHGRDALDSVGLATAATAIALILPACVAYSYRRRRGQTAYLRSRITALMEVD